MKTRLTLLLLIGLAGSSFAATTLNPTNKFAYGANLGWMDWRGGAGGTPVAILAPQAHCSM